ncbi:MAG: ATP-binding protein [Deferrisomatales bacterium]
MTALSGLLEVAAGLRRRLAVREDSEHEQALIRVVIGVAATSFVAVVALQDGHVSAREAVTLAFGLVFVVFAVGNVLAILASPGPSHARRVAGIVVDIAVTAMGMHVQQDGGAPFYLFFLWVIFGNGFRFGVRYLYVATVASWIGFGLVVAFSPYWRSQLSLSAALLLPLLVLPVYVAFLLRKLTEARARAEEASLAKSQFLANMSHEIRTPVHGMLGSLELLQRLSLDREQQELVKTMHLSTAGLLSLLESVLDVSRFEAGGVELQEADFDLHLLLQETVRIFQPQAKAKGLDLRLTVNPEVPYALRGDAIRFKQVVMNLVGNAVKFTEKGHVGMEVRKGSGTLPDAVTVLFEVCDTGVGIPQQALERIFERFSQGDATVTRRFGGAGLGLAIVRQIVSLMEGTIQVESAEGKGSRFSVAIPFRLQARATVPVSEPGHPRRQPLPILLVAATSAVSAQVAKWLESWGYVAHVVSSPDEARARLVSLEAQDLLPRVVMVFGEGLAPGPQGGASTLRRDPVLAGVPFLFVPSGPEGTSRTQELTGYVAVLPPWPPKTAVFNALHLALAGAERGAVPGAGNLIRFPTGESSVKKGRILRVLLVDDNATNRKIAARILESAGHVVRLAESVEAGLDALEVQSFDVAVLDLHMPGLSGMEMARLLRFSPRAAPPLVALTANAVPETREACLEAGFTAFVTKPIGATALVETVESAAQTRPARPSDRPVLEPGVGLPPKKASERVAAPSFDPSQARALAAIDSRREFWGQVWEGFESDVDRLLQRLEQAVQERDLPRVREHIQAVRSSAETVGAARLAEACKGILSGGDPRQDQSSGVALLNAEFGAARLLKYRFFAAAASAASNGTVSGEGSPLRSVAPSPRGEPAVPGIGPASS